MNRTARSFVGAGLIALLTQIALPGPAAVQDPDRGGGATVALTGDGLAIEGTYPATRCGQLGGGGAISFQVPVEQWVVTVSAERRAGVVPLDGPDGDQVHVSVRGPAGAWERSAPGGWVQITPGFRSARVDVPLRAGGSGARGRLVVTFDCG